MVKDVFIMLYLVLILIVILDDIVELFDFILYSKVKYLFCNIRYYIFWLFIIKISIFVKEE